MAKVYPQFRSSYSHEEMVEHFLLTQAGLQLVLTCRGNANPCGMALRYRAKAQPGSTHPRASMIVRSQLERTLRSSDG
jgi:hypothetical protein